MTPDRRGARQPLDFAPKLPADKVRENFADINPPLTKNTSVHEGMRCLYCQDAPCIAACPTGIDIPTYIRKITTGNVTGAAKTIYSSNVFGGSCARVCPVDVLCEGACVYNHLSERPVTIALLQRYATDHAMKNKLQFFTPGKPTGKKVAVIGAGPSGLACAHELRVLGHAVTVFEAKNILGGLNTWGIAEYKMGKDVSLYEVRMILDIGVEVKEKSPVTPEAMAKLEKEFDAIFIGIGPGETTPLEIPGEDLPGVRDALSFIEEIKMKPLHTVDVGRRVAVIGAGNTAVDAATQAKRLGAEWVAMVYRRGEENMSAYEYEYDLAKKDGVVFYFQTAPTKIAGRGAVSGLECVKMKLGAPDAKGKPSMKPVTGSEFTIPVDMVIKAVGQQKQVGVLSRVKGLALEPNGRIKTDPKTGQTSNAKYFAGGDCANGGKEVVNATAEGKRAARGIHAYLGGKS